MPTSLYQSQYERDACGFGLIAQIDGTPSNGLVVDALGALESMTHRGAVAADGLSGDGCGMLLSQPTEFFRSVLARQDVTLPEQFAVGNHHGRRWRNHGCAEPELDRLRLALRLRAPVTRSRCRRA